MHRRSGFHRWRPYWAGTRRPPPDSRPRKPSPSHPRSLRKKSVRGPGKQSGEPGARLKSWEEPDEIKVYAPSGCASCGDDLAGAPVVGEQRRQVLGWPCPDSVARGRAPRPAAGLRVRGGDHCELPDRGHRTGVLRARGRRVGRLPTGGQHLPVERAAVHLALPLQPTPPAHGVDWSVALYSVDERVRCEHSV